MVRTILFYFSSNPITSYNNYDVIRALGLSLIPKPNWSSDQPRRYNNHDKRSSSYF